jgi:hypothetical protein
MPPLVLRSGAFHKLKQGVKQMSSDEVKQCISMPAGSDLTGSQFRAVEISDSNECGIAADATAPFLGVLQNKPDEGQVAEIQIGGVTKMKMSGAGGSAGAIVTATTAGVGVATTTPEDYVIGQALEDWAANGIARVLLYGPGAHFPTA